MLVQNSTLTGNSAGSRGGGAHNAFGTMTLENTLISGNTAASGSELSNNNGTLTLNANNLFGHSGLTNAQAFDLYNATPGAAS